MVSTIKVYFQFSFSFQNLKFDYYINLTTLKLYVDLILKLQLNIQDKKIQRKMWTNTSNRFFFFVIKLGEKKDI